MISGTSSRSNNSSLPVIEQAETSSKQPGITLSDNKNTFSLSRLCSSQAPLSSQLNHSDPIIVKQYNGLGIFDHHVFSKPFATRYYNAKNAIESSNNKEHIAKTGEFSPEAKKAVTKFISIVYGKNADTSTAAKTRQVFLDGPLTDIEKKAWHDFVSQLPETYIAETFSTNPWRAVNADEVRDALKSERGFAPFIDTARGENFVQSLASAINHKSAEMLPTDRGMALVLRFGSTYEAVNHVALAALWRDDSGKLCMGVCHQESVPPHQPKDPNNPDAKKPAIKITTGVTFNTFDTSHYYPTGIAPVLESIKFTGLPTVNVYPCPNPRAIINTTDKISGADHAHPYGPTDTWLKPEHKGAYKDKVFETCFNVTHKVMAKLYNVKTAHMQTLPDILNDMRPIVAIRPDEFNAFTFPSNSGDKSPVVVSLDSVPDQAFNTQVQVFKQIGQLWGLSLPWDVGIATKPVTTKAVMQPGQVGLIPDSAAQDATQFKFLVEPKHLRFNNNPVLLKKSYSRDELNQMTHIGPEKSTYHLIGSVPLPAIAGNSRAKL